MKSKNSYDVVIIGAGPAGLKCAETLLKSNLSVAVFERQPAIKKACAGFYGLTSKTLKWGFPHFLFEKKFKKIVVYFKNEKVVISYPRPFVASLNRKKLADFQQKIIKNKEIKLFLGAAVTKITPEYIICQNKKFYYKTLVGADGSNSLTRKFLRLKTKIGIGMQYWVAGKYFKELKIFIDRSKFGPWYLWAIPHSKRISIGIGGESLNGKPAKFFVPAMKKKLQDWLQENKINYQESSFEAAPISYFYQGFSFGNIFLVGDAAGLASKLTGEGIYFALASGFDIAHKIINSQYSCPNIKKVLNIKKKHHLIFWGMNHFEPVFIKLAPILLKNKLIKKLAIELLA